MAQLVADHNLDPDSEATYVPFGLAGYARVNLAHELELVCSPEDLTPDSLQNLLRANLPQLVWTRSWQTDIVRASGLKETRRIHLLRADATTSASLPHANLSHVTKLAQLEAASYADTPYRPLSLEQRVTYLANALRRGETILYAVQADEIVGFAWLLDDFGPARNVELHVLAVDPLATRSGIGTLLVQATRHEAALRGANHVYLYCDSTNVAALRLYQKHGFESAGHDLVGFSCPR